MPSISVVLRDATNRLADIGAGRAEAEWLLAWVLGVSRQGLITGPDVDDAQLSRYRALLDQRLHGVPLQHLLGSAPFRHLELKVGPGVFVPRPETELVLDLVADALQNASCAVDLCAGSGALAIAIATEYPSCAVIAVERSAAALPWLRRNVADLAPEVRVVAGDVADPALLSAAGPLADVEATVVVSNPPYVPESRRETISAEVRHDPDDAVFAGSDGLATIGAVLPAAAQLLRGGGLLVMEHDDSHQPAVLEMLVRAGVWTNVQGHRDLAGLPRFISAVRQDDAHEQSDWRDERSPRRADDR